MTVVANRKTQPIWNLPPDNPLTYFFFACVSCLIHKPFKVTSLGHLGQTKSLISEDLIDGSKTMQPLNLVGNMPWA
jgi:hypothetical protein